MFPFLGKTVARLWPLILLGWCAAAILTAYFAPRWDAVVSPGDAGFLPGDSPSRQAEELFDQAFPGRRIPSSIVLVLHREAESGLTPADQRFLRETLKPRLDRLTQAPDSHGLISRVRTSAEAGIGPLLNSIDHQATLVIVELKTASVDRANWSMGTAVQNVLDELAAEHLTPNGLTIDVTGSAMLGAAVTQAEAASVDATKFWTILLVVVLLLVIYRAPFLIVIPLATVYVGVEIALNLLAMLAAAKVVSLFEGAQIYVTILGYGAGVDYCLFLIARYQEELERGAEPRQALIHAVGKVGGALTASAATVICGIAMMAFASFGRFHQAGIVIPFGLVVVWCAAMTFSPSLLGLVGRWAFWPGALSRKPASRSDQPEAHRRLVRQPFQHVWESLAAHLRRRPLRIWLSCVLVMVPFLVVGLLQQNHLDFGLIDKLPNGSRAVRGTQALEAHYPAGMLGQTTVLLRNDRIDFRQPESLKPIETWTNRLKARTDELGIADLRSLAAPLGVSPIAAETYAQLSAPASGTTPRNVPTSAFSPDMVEEIVRQRALNYYVADGSERAGHVTRLDLVMKRDPFATESIGQLDAAQRALRESLPAELRQGSQLEVFGSIATLRDLQTVTNRDRRLIGILVPAVVFVILLILLHRWAISLYLIGSVMFSYFVTLGVTICVFWLLDPKGFLGLDWKVPVFLFTILVAVGEDYNIFLMSRTREEQALLGGMEGITSALVKTGGIISRCGIIMAGTFGSLAAGSLPELKQMGVALALGVLLDTLVVRPILVPAFLILLERRRTPTVA